MPEDTSVNGQLGQIIGKLTGIEGSIGDMKGNIGKLFEKSNEHGEQLARVETSVEAMEKGFGDSMKTLNDRQDGIGKRLWGLLAGMLIATIAGLIALLKRG